jgi:putative transposase
MSCPAYRFELRRCDEAALKMRIKEITDTHMHYSYHRAYVMLRREAHADKVKRCAFDLELADSIMPARAGARPTMWDRWLRP